MAMMMVSVSRRYGIVGGRKTGTPLLTASTPVMAVHPLANDAHEQPESQRFGRRSDDAGGAPPAIG